MKNKLITSIVVAGSLTFATTAMAEDIVNVYNWSDYIDEEAIPAFEKATGIRVRYDLFDGMPTLETKLLTGNSGYDVTVPTSSTVERMAAAGALMPLDKSKLPNLKHLDPAMMAELAGFDPGNKYAVPYLWGTVGLGYNVSMIKKRLPNAAVDSLDLIFKPENAAKLADCGIGMIDDPGEITVIVLNYLGLDPYSGKKADLKAAEDLLMSIRPHIRYVKGTGYLDDLANGEICVMLGYSVDMFQVQSTIEKNKSDTKVAFSIPSEGTVLYFDTLAIPAGAPNADNAHKFINHMMDPNVAAKLSNFLWTANANSGSNEFLDPELKADTAVYPSAATVAKLKANITVPQKIVRARTRLLTKFKTGN